MKTAVRSFLIAAMLICIVETGVSKRPIKHSVTVFWRADIGSCLLTGYKIYRNDVTYTTVASTQLNYRDTNVQSGQTYTYKVASVTAGKESAASNTVTAVIPRP